MRDERFSGLARARVTDPRDIEQRIADPRQSGYGAQRLRDAACLGRQRGDDPERGGLQSRVGEIKLRYWAIAQSGKYLV